MIFKKGEKSVTLRKFLSMRVHVNQGLHIPLAI